jgi:hypothetical protein
LVPVMQVALDINYYCNSMLLDDVSLNLLELLPFFSI